VPLSGDLASDGVPPSSGATSLGVEAEMWLLSV
jgi:hypothetical protein